MDQFKKEAMFKDDLSELDESREVVDCLVQEYEAATQPNYLSWQGKCRLIDLAINGFVIFMSFICLFVFQLKNQQLKYCLHKKKLNCIHIISCQIEEYSNQRLTLHLNFGFMHKNVFLQILFFFSNKNQI